MASTSSSSSSSSSSLEKKHSPRSVLLPLVGFVIVLQCTLIPYVILKHHPTTATPPSSSSISSSSSSSWSIKNNQRIIRQQQQLQQQQFHTRNKRKRQLHSSSFVNRTPDGTFNGYPMYYRPANTTPTDHPFHSTVHCVGENYRPNAWIHRSCHFRNLCWDRQQQDFVLFQSPQERDMLEHLLANDDPNNIRPHKFAKPSNHMNTTVSLGGINTKWTWKHGVPRLEWFPQILDPSLLRQEGYYTLDPSVVMIPFHSLAGFNAGHLIWDDWLPIWTLLQIFGLSSDEHYQPLLLRYILKGPRMWATCDMNEVRQKDCQHMFAKFLPLFGLEPQHFSTTHDIRIEEFANLSTSTEQTPHNRSRFICAANGAAGLGMLTDHGIKLHGWDKGDYDAMHNQGRGAMFYEFRNFMIRNVGMDPNLPLPSSPPHTIIFSLGSSRSSLRDFSFRLQRHRLQQTFGSQIQIETVQFQSLSASEQLQLVSRAALLVTACGGGAVTASFLPRGAAVILYYVEDGGVENNRHTGRPAFLDWDFFNNAGYLRTHWLPSGTMDRDIDLFVKLVAHELDIVSHQGETI